MPVQGRHPSEYAWRPGRSPDTEPDYGRFPPASTHRALSPQVLVGSRVR